VMGSMVEQVSCLSLAERFGIDTDGWVRYPKALMLINENGIALGLDYNVNATALYAPERAQQAHRGGPLAIFGDAFLIGNRVAKDGMDWADLPSDISVADIKGLITQRL
jgi:hypothetical protein